MLNIHWYFWASQSPRVNPPHGSSGGRISTAADGVVAILVSAADSGVTATVDSATVSKVALAPLDSATARPTSTDTDTIAATEM